MKFYENNVNYFTEKKIQNFTLGKALQNSPGTEKKIASVKKSEEPLEGVAHFLWERLL